jgi:2-haloacid dehalogenase
MFPSEEEMEWFLTNVCHSDWNNEQDAGRPFEEAIREKVDEFPQLELEIEAYYSRWDEMLGGEIHENVKILRDIEAKGEIDLYALTNWSHQTFPIAQDNYNFLDLFKGIVVSGVEKMKKPDVSIYLVIMERYDLEPENTLFIDDSLPNVEVAKDLGFKTIHFKEPGTLQKEIEMIIGR